MLKPGTYKLSRDVENPKPDRRKSRDWRAEVTWEKDTEFLVEAERIRDVYEPDDSLDEVTKQKIRDAQPMWLRICLVGHRYKHESITMGSTVEQYRALEMALVPCETSNAAFFTAHDVNEHFARWLIETGRLSRELYLKLHEEYEDDGELRGSDSYPQRRALIEDALPPGSYVADSLKVDESGDALHLTFNVAGHPMALTIKKGA